MEPLREKEKRITIVGAGIVGLTCGIALIRQGLEVEIIDKEGPGSGASKGNAGHFATEQVFPLADPALLPKLPGMLLDPLGPFSIQPKYFHRAIPWFARFLFNMIPSKRAHNTSAIKALNQNAIDSMQELVNFCDRPDLLIRNGSLLVFEGAKFEQVVKQFRHYHNGGVKVSLLSGDEVRALEPSISEKVTHGLHFTEVGHTPDPYALCLALADKFTALGGKFRTLELKKISGCAPFHLQAEDGEQISTWQLLIASGAWSKPFAAQLGHRVPLDTERGYHLMMPQHSKLSRPVASFERKFIITPMAQGTRLAGVVEFAGLKAPLQEKRADNLFTHGQALLPKVFAKAQASDGSRWMGFRPSLPDSLPILGRSKKQKNLYFSFGHQHLGLTWSAITAHLVSQEISGEQADIDLTPYRIERF